MTFKGISYRDAAEMLGVDVQFIRKLVRDGTLPAHRLSSNLVRVDLGSVQALLDVTRTMPGGTSAQGMASGRGPRAPRSTAPAEELRDGRGESPS